MPNPSKGVFIVYEEEKAQVLNQKVEKIFSNYELVEAIKSSENTNEMEKHALKYKKGDKYGIKIGRASCRERVSF